MKSLFPLLALVFVLGCVPSGLSFVQSCNPAVVSYIIRDESGHILSAPALESVFKQLPKSIGDAQCDVGNASISDDRMSFYWPESVDWSKGEKIPVLEFINSRTCTMHLTEATLTYKDKKMRLIFNLDIARHQPDRRPLIDSVPFQEGTFELDLHGWSHETHKIIGSDRWKRVKRS